MIEPATLKSAKGSGIESPPHFGLNGDLAVNQITSTQIGHYQRLPILSQCRFGRRSWYHPFRMVLLDEPRIGQRSIQVRFGKLGYFLGELFVLAQGSIRYYLRPNVSRQMATGSARLWISREATEKVNWEAEKSVIQSAIRFGNRFFVR